MLGLEDVLPVKEELTVEVAAGEVADVWVHSVLDGKKRRLQAPALEALEHAAAVVALLCRLQSMASSARQKKL